MSVLTGFRDFALAWLLPAPCLACGAVEPGPAPPLSLCAGCRGRLKRLGPGCARCGRPLPGAHPPAGYTCAACRAQRPPFERLLAAWSYEPPLDAVIHGLKFRRLDYLGSHLARAMVPLLGPALDGWDLLVPVPLHWHRRLVRGYNQAEQIARPLATLLRLPCRSALRRARPTAAQTRLGREERLRNLERAFRLRRGAEVGGRKILLVDDVYTTGATLVAAAVCMRRGGAAAVAAVVAGRTPEPG